MPSRRGAIRPLRRAGLVAGLLLFLASTGHAAAGDLLVTVTNIRNSDGILRVALFDRASEFPEGEERASVDVPAQAGLVTVTFDEIPVGRYAIAVHHDENGNGEMDTNFLGVPREGYGFSNDAKVFLGPPAFEAAAFGAPLKRSEISLRLRY